MQANPLATSPIYINRDHQRQTRMRTLNERHTSIKRSASGRVFTNSSMFPFDIHFDIVANRFSVIVAPSRGNTFGWRRPLHAMTSLQNLCAGKSVCRHTQRVEDCSHFQSAPCRLSGMPSKPSLQHPHRCGDPSTRPQTHRWTAGTPLCRIVTQLPAISELEFGDHKCQINGAGTSCGVVVRGHLTPTQQDAGV